MLNTILNSKAGRVSRDKLDKQDSIRWRDLFLTSEDLLTGTIFERLSYLPAELAWDLLVSAASAPLPRYRVVDLIEIEFWPQWYRKKDGANDPKTRVEPDVFLKISLGDPARSVHVIVEAKHWGPQYSNQWLSELNAWHDTVLAEEDCPPDEVIFIALGGLGNLAEKTKNSAVFLEKAHAMDLKGVRLSLAMISWKNLDVALQVDRQVKPHEALILKDMSEALLLAGHHELKKPRQLEAIFSQRRMRRNAVARGMLFNRLATKKGLG